MNKENISIEIDNTLLESVKKFKKRIGEVNCDTEELIEISKTLIQIGQYLYL